MVTEPVLLIAAGGLARETLAAIGACGAQHVVGMLDDNPDLHGTSIAGVGVLGGLDVVQGRAEVRLVVCAGSGVARESIVGRLADLGVEAERYATVIHPGVSIPAGCRLGEGTVILAGVSLTSDVAVGSHVVVMPNATLTHDVVVADYATVCAGVSLGGGVRVGRAAYLGMNASVRQQVRIGAGAVIGMGAVVLQDTGDHAIVVGNPARDLARRPTIGAQRRSVSSGGIGQGEGR